ncbi:MAG: CPBP family glutamic-type intramembrane protease [Verrucomicrobiota bacterium]
MIRKTCSWFWGQKGDFTWLFVGSLIVVGLLWLIGGIRPYYAEIARECLDEKGFFIFVAIVCSLAVAAEIVVRRLQRKLAPRFGAVIAIGLMSVAYAAIHFRFGVLGIAHALVISAIAGIVFLRCNRIATLAIWRGCWELAMIVFFVLSAIFINGLPKTVLLYEYKRSQIVEGGFLWVEDWGWLDTHHLADDLLIELIDELNANKGGSVQHTFVHAHRRHFIGPHRVEHTYDFNVKESASPQEIHAMASAALWDSAMRHEAIQGAEPAYAGGAMSAFAWEDLATVLLAAYLTQPADHPALDIRTVDIEKDLVRWKADGDATIQARIYKIEDFKPDGANVASNISILVERMKAAEDSFSFSEENSH